MVAPNKLPAATFRSSARQHFTRPRQIACGYRASRKYHEACRVMGNKIIAARTRPASYSRCARMAHAANAEKRWVQPDAPLPRLR